MNTIEDVVYRPPLESHSALLEITLGCSWGHCTFCHYSDKKTPLQLVSYNTICENLDELSKEQNRPKRMFLTGGNVLALKTAYLLDLFALVKSYLSNVREFAMYARADDVGYKSDDQLKKLSEAGLDTLYIGIESGSKEILSSCAKGETLEEMEEALYRLDRTNIRYGLSSILGLGGEERWKENAVKTAEFYNRVTPASIRVMTLTPMKGTVLANNVASGKFRLPSVKMILEEELLLLQTISPQLRCLFVATHPSNYVPLVGILPNDRERMIKSLTDVLESHHCELTRKEIVKW